MYFSIDLLTPSGSTLEIDVTEDTFRLLLKDIFDSGLKTVAVKDDHGGYQYYLWNIQNDFVYFGNSSELIKDYLNSDF